MPWSTGYRQPGNWRSLRQRVLERDGWICYLCSGVAVTVDHVVSVKQGGTHDPANLAAICQPCHDRKTQAEAQAGRVKRKREPETHPGRIA